VMNPFAAGRCAERFASVGRHQPEGSSAKVR